MRISLNGDERDVRDGSCIAEVVAALVSDASATAVARNGEVVPRSMWSGVALEAGDRLEVVSAAPGG